MLNLVDNSPGNNIRGRIISLINLKGNIEIEGNIF